MVELLCYLDVFPLQKILSLTEINLFDGLTNVQDEAPYRQI